MFKLAASSSSVEKTVQREMKRATGLTNADGPCIKKRVTEKGISIIFHFNCNLLKSTVEHVYIKKQVY